MSTNQNQIEMVSGQYVIKTKFGTDNCRAIARRFGLVFFRLQSTRINGDGSREVVESAVTSIDATDFGRMATPKPTPVGPSVFGQKVFEGAIVRVQGYEFEAKNVRQHAAGGSWKYPVIRFDGVCTPNPVNDSIRGTAYNGGRYGGNRLAGYDWDDSVPFAH